MSNFNLFAKRRLPGPGSGNSAFLGDTPVLQGSQGTPYRPFRLGHPPVIYNQGLLVQGAPGNYAGQYIGQPLGQNPFQYEIGTLPIVG